MVLFFLLTLLVRIKGKIVCDVPESGLILAEFYKEDSSLHQLMEPIVNVVANVSKATDSPINIQKINCDICNCNGIEKFPSFKLVKDGLTLDSFFGFKSYEKLVDFIASNSKIKARDFLKEGDAKDEIVELEEKDFYSGFKGPWLVLFYFEDNEEDLKVLRNIKNIFKDKLTIGRIQRNKVGQLASRFHLQNQSTLFAISNDLHVPFLDDFNLKNLIKFTTRFIEPAFKTITYQEMLNLSKDDYKREPIFVVLSHNEKKANELFFRYAYNFKFRTRIYNSVDPEMFKHANLTPGKDETRLTVFKNGLFHVYEGSIEDQDAIIEWIFHTHFPNVTKISNSTFHSIFNGIKPVFLLLTENDKFLEQFEFFSNNIHLGKPYLHTLFASINLDEYALFTASLLPKIEVPTFVVYNPLDKKFYHKKIDLKRENFNEQAESVLKAFETGNLKAYSKESNFGYVYLGLAFGLILVGLMVYLRRKSMRII